MFLLSSEDIQLPEFGTSQKLLLWGILIISLVALVYAFVLRRQVLQASEGSEKMKSIAKRIQSGANTYLKEQFKVVGIFVCILCIILLFALPVPEHLSHSAILIRIARAGAFVVGAAFSATTGFMGMWLAVRANVRTAQAAKDTGIRGAMRIAFSAGGVAGMFTVGLGLLGATLILIIFGTDATSVLVGFGFGGALLAMFMRVGGGIYTKAADVGADLVGKVEQGIPEDDPRNPATIADNVGDNVGDCAGMAADLFESYEVTLVAALILGASAFTQDPKFALLAVMFPLIVRAVGVITSIIGIIAVRPRSDQEHGMTAINRGFFISAGVSAVIVGIISHFYMHSFKPALAVIIGLVLASSIQILTQYFTDTKYRPVKDVAASTQTGPATTILSGFTVGLESSVWAILVVGATIFAGALLGQGNANAALYYISLTGMGMLTTVGVIVSMDTYGPISDNAQGIAEMSGEFEGESAKVLTNLDAVGNSTKAITKGVAIATAVIAATSMFGSFKDSLGIQNLKFDVSDPKILVGLLIGGSIAFLFSSLAIGAVSRAAEQVVVEIRSQFSKNPKILKGQEDPDSDKVIAICTKTSLKELMTPGLLAVLSPLLVGFALGYEALGGFLAGSILTGQLLAVMLSNSGGAWDNAKKYVEDGFFGGKNSEAHKASVIGDTVGDPFKDTAGPALNPLIKVMNLISVLAAGAFISYQSNVPVRIGVSLICLIIIVGFIIRSKSEKRIDILN